MEDATFFTAPETSYAETVSAHVVPVIARMGAASFHMEGATSHMEDVTFHVEVATSQMLPVCATRSLQCSPLFI